MRERGDLRPDADARQLAVALVAAHQGGALITYATGGPEPLRVAVNAAVDYVRSFAPVPKSRRSRTPSRRKPKNFPTGMTSPSIHSKSLDKNGFN
jgi:TetR/AcrR family transcriptional regulator, transcriptional repressor for nem operon